MLPGSLLAVLDTFWLDVCKSEVSLMHTKSGQCCLMMPCRLNRGFVCRRISRHLYVRMPQPWYARMVYRLRIIQYFNKFRAVEAWQLLLLKRISQPSQQPNLRSLHSRIVPPLLKQIPLPLHPRPVLRILLAIPLTPHTLLFQ